MDTVTKKYIETVQVSDIPWHRLTTTYGRATDFPSSDVSNSGIANKSTCWE